MIIILVLNCNLATDDSHASCHTRGAMEPMKFNKCTGGDEITRRGGEKVAAKCTHSGYTTDDESINSGLIQSASARQRFIAIP